MDPLSGKPHIPPPGLPIKGEFTINPPQHLGPLVAPPKLIPLPTPLPEELSRKCPFTPTHTLSVHILPAAFPRAASPPGQIVIPPMEYFSDKTRKDDRKKWMTMTMEKLTWQDAEAAKMFPDPKAQIKVAGEGLWSTVLRIRRNKPAPGEKGITIICLHPIGFHKEIWEPMFRHLLQITESSASPIRIEEIWSLDAVSHGDAALLNNVHIAKLPDRADYARDLANFLIHHLPEGRDAFGNDLAQKLPRLPTSISRARVKNGFQDRQVVAMGHSLGGDATAMCGISYPRLFPALILIETTLFPPSQNDSKLVSAMILSTLGRRSSWPSREEAKRTLLKSSVFRAFDQEIVDAYIAHGMYEDKKTGEVHLKCNPGAEASEYTRPQTINKGWELLRTLDENVELRWVMGGSKDASVLVGGPQVSRETIWRRARNASNIVIPGAGHLVVQEKPNEVAEDVALFLTHKFSSDKNKGHSKL
ncbi:Alpha/beta hydrolase family-domain-containing protein [Flammula alnicola]|nr:Alpha/beta hydrolase family-domain-containing protein [Flammula alnicola]